MDKLDPKTDGASQDIVADNIDKLRELFPDAFTEGSDADGPRWKVDFDALKACLGEYVEDERERYSFTWHGKARARRIAQTPSAGTLRPCPEESVNWDTTQNLFIEGDNLEVLKLLQKSYHKQVKMIYIDPPYNTGGEFIYPDRFQDNLDTYLRYTGQMDGEGFKTSANSESAGRYHTNWLNMVYPRLRLARNLLRDDGVIFISIDDTESGNIKKILDEIFGEENFVANFVWQKRTTRENRSVFSFNHDYVLCYARHIQDFTTTRPLLPLTEAVKKRYSNPDSDKRGPWQSVSLNAQAGPGRRSEQFYSVTTPGGRVVDPPAGRCWIVTKVRMDELIAENRVWFGENGNNVPRQKIFLPDAREGLTPHTLWTADEVGTNDSAKKELTKLFDGVSVFDTPKPVELLARIIDLSMADGGIALDFFAGSAPLAEATLKASAKDGYQRRFIAVQLPEAIDDSLPQSRRIRELGLLSIADIGKERVRRITKQLSDQGTEQVCGFKVFKLSDSNIVPWAPGTDDLKTSLFDSVDNIRHDRSEADVLSELLLKYGLDLAVPIEARDINGKTVHIIGAGALVVCLADAVDLELVTGIAALKTELAPEVMRVVFKDNGFANDVVKTNAVQILRQAGVEDVKSL